MPVYDRRCIQCGVEKLDVLEEIKAEPPQCVCGGIMSRVWTSKAGSVQDDSIPGGLLIYNTLCYADGTPRRFDSYTELNRAAEAAGVHNHVEHIGAKGSDKSKHTTRWVSTPTISEEDRLKRWYEHEAQLGQ